MTRVKHLVGTPWARAAMALAAAAVVLGVAVWPVPAGAASADPAVGRRGPAGRPDPSADPAPHAPRPTITLGLDDGTIDQFRVGKLLQENGLRGVFYLNSGRLSTNAQYLTVAQVRELQQDGHEIGGHSTYHLHLAQQDLAEQQRQVCDDRVQLLSDGLNVSSFAYPFGEFTAATEDIVKSCGYTSARTARGIGCSACTRSETVPPAVPFGTRALSSFGNTTTSADLIASVRRIMDRAGWLQLAFHRICAAATCAGNSVRLAEFTGFVHWLAEQRAAGALNVATVQQVMGAEVRPGVPGPAPTATRLVFGNRSTERQSATAGYPPACFTYGSPGAGSVGAWKPAEEPHTGRWALRADVTAAGAGVRLFTTPDLGSCAPPIRPHRSYRIGVWYRATAPIKMITYLRQPRGSYRSFGSAVTFAPAATWTLASWVTRATPDRSNMALSISIVAADVGTYLVDDLSVRLVRPAPVARAGGSGDGVAPRRERDASGAGSAAPAGAEAGAGGSPAARVDTPMVPQSQHTSAGNYAEIDDDVPFLPTNPQSVVPVAARRGEDRVLDGRSPWWELAQIGVALLVAFGMIVLLDRRFGHLHSRTLQPLAARRSSPSIRRLLGIASK
jgi:peptidoglycan/xylan/chitin deacetylase (PgdA/CDA1 family)